MPNVCTREIKVEDDDSCEPIHWKFCHYCTYKTQYSGNLQLHVATMHTHERSRRKTFEKHRYFRCCLCNYASAVKQGLKNHMIARHTERTDNECPQCGRKLKNELCLKSHLQYCGKKAVHQCHHCSFKTKYRNHLKRHLSNVHTNDNAIACTNMCGSVLKNKESLRGHLIFCGSELSNVSCPYCSFRPKRVKLLQLHISRVHCDENNRVNECPKCARRFKKVKYLSKHVKVCDAKRFVQCDSCCYKSNKKGPLEKHITNEHLHLVQNEDKTCSLLCCIRCGSGFKTQEGLSEHLIRCSDDSGLQCYHCPFKARIKNHLKQHILIAHIENNELFTINMTNFFEVQMFHE